MPRNYKGHENAENVVPTDHVSTAKLKLSGSITVIIVGKARWSNF